MTIVRLVPFFVIQVADTGIQEIQPQMSTLGSCIIKAGFQCQLLA
ncbi:hypothetical protein [Wolbachia endosymbiont (group B) of Limnophora tigrina]